LMIDLFCQAQRGFLLFLTVNLGVDNNPALSNNDEIPRMGGELVPPFTFDLPLPSGSWLRL